MTGQALWANNAVSATLAASITDSQTTITVTSGSGAQFPNPGAGQFFPLTLISATNNADLEITYCTARSGDTLTIVRAQESTAAQAFAAGSLAQNLLTEGTVALFGQTGTSNFWLANQVLANNVTLSGKDASGTSHALIGITPGGTPNVLIDSGGIGASTGGNLTVNDNLTVNGNATVDGTLTVDSTASFAGAVTVGTIKAPAQLLLEVATNAAVVNGSNTGFLPLLCGTSSDPNAATTNGEFTNVSNGNGTAYIFVGGMQLARNSIAGVPANGSATWTFPLAFPSTPQAFVTATIPGAPAPSAFWISSISTTSATFFNPNSFAINVDLLAVL